MKVSINDDETGQAWTGAAKIDYLYNELINLAMLMDKSYNETIKEDFRTVLQRS